MWKLDSSATPYANLYYPLTVGLFVGFDGISVVVICLCMMNSELKASLAPEPLSVHSCYRACIYMPPIYTYI